MTKGITIVKPSFTFRDYFSSRRFHIRSAQIPIFVRSASHWRPPRQRGQNGSGKKYRKGVSEKAIEAEKVAKEEWDIRVEEIKAGTRKDLLQLLEQRGYVNSVAGSRGELKQLMIQKRFGAYVGVDPTAPSLHVGHLLPFMALFWLYIHGVHTVSILGDGTAKIGDPTGRTTTRTAMPSEERKLNAINMHFQLKHLWVNMEKHAKKYGYIRHPVWRRGQMNNSIWLSKLSVTEFLMVLGNGARVGTMLGRDTVRNKLDKGDGMSFSEFTYPLLQAWDWWKIYQSKGITVQIGGSDQLGNIMAGIDAIKYILKNHSDPDMRYEKEGNLPRKPMGFTVPLLTTASGEKFGKSAGNAVWLNKQMTSVFEQYQFFLRSSDADVGRYLRLFTFIPMPEIKQLIVEHQKAPSKRIAQRRLAQEVIALIHGESEVEAVESQQRRLFSSSSVAKTESNSTNEPEDSSPPETIVGGGTVMNIVLPKSLVYNQPMGRILYAASLVTSRSEGHRLVIKGGAYIGSEPNQAGGMGDEVKFTSIVDWDPQYIQKFMLEGDILLLRVGKRKIRTVKVIDDEDFEAQGLDCPGWKEWKEGQSVVDPQEESQKKMWRENPIDRRSLAKRAGWLYQEEESENVEKVERAEEEEESVVNRIFPTDEEKTV